MKFAAAMFPFVPRELSMNVTWSATALVGMLCVSGSPVCARAAVAPPNASVPAARHAPVSALTRRVVRFPPYNRSPSPADPAPAARIAPEALVVIVPPPRDRGVQISVGTSARWSRHLERSPARADGPPGAPDGRSGPL